MGRVMMETKSGGERALESESRAFCIRRHKMKEIDGVAVSKGKGE